MSMILYCLGNADDMLTSTNITDKSRKEYSCVMAKFDDFFKIRKNIIFERAKFKYCNQLSGESAENIPLPTCRDMLVW